MLGLWSTLAFMSEKISKDRFRHYDSPLEATPPKYPQPPVVPNKPVPLKVKWPKRRKYKYRIMLSTLLLLIIIGVAGTLAYRDRTTSPVPKTISQSITFPVYYPDPKKLPAGYTLDLSSFSTPVKNGVTYWVNYGKGNKIVFSIQRKPSNGELQTFDGNYLPLEISYQTPVGMAEIGAYNLKTLVSLPTNSSAWVIITAPPNIDQGQLEQILSIMKKD
jgi:hypothetical protein